MKSLRVAAGPFGRTVFSAFGSQSVIAEFIGGQISSSGGASLLREAERSLKLVERLAACIADPRVGGLADRATNLKRLTVALANQIMTPRGCRRLHNTKTIRSRAVG